MGDGWGITSKKVFLNFNSICLAFYSAEVSVSIKVVDQSVPLFGSQLYRATVKEDIQAFSPILTVKAESPSQAGPTDSPGSGSQLFYTIESGNNNEQFAVDYQSGVISVAYRCVRYHTLGNIRIYRLLLTFTATGEH